MHLEIAKMVSSMQPILTTIRKNKNGKKKHWGK